MKTTLLSIASGIIAPFASFCAAAVTKLPTEDHKALVRGAESVRMLRSISDIPKDIVQICASVAAGHEFRLANPGEPFQATDVIIHRNLPRRRLLWAAQIPGYCVVHYESGGYAHSYHILVVGIDRSPKQARVVWSAAAIPLKNYLDFLAALKSQTLDDTLDYYH